MNDLISVVVTCYNHEQYIEQCLRSIFSQTYRKIELIVLNDGSTDGSAELIDRVLEDSPFETRFESHENMGVVKTRNKALEILSGKFFVFVDSDDFLDKETTFMKATDFNLQKLLTHNYISNCSLVRTDVLDGVHYDENLIGKKLEDYDFFLNLIINKQAKAVYQPDTKLNYRVFEKNSISRRDSEQYHYEKIPS